MATEPTPQQVLDDTIDGLGGWLEGRHILEALAAAGFRVVRSDADLAARLWDLCRNGPTSTWRDDVRAAAALLDPEGDPSDG